MKDTQNAQQSYKKLKYSYHPEVTFDLTKKEGGEKSKGWILTETNWEENSLIEMVKTISYLPSKLKNGHKVKKNVEEVYSIILDFDKNDPTLEQFKENWKATQFSWFLHTTLNHQKSVSNEGIPLTPSDRFRVIIPLSRPISKKDLEKMKDFWEGKFPNIDPTSFDGNRYFKMNPNAITHLRNYFDLEGNIVFLNPDDEGLITQKKKVGRPKNNEFTFSKEDEVILEDGNTREKIKDIDAGKKIFCPFCDHSTRTHPDIANAILNINNAGQLTIYCFTDSHLYFQIGEELDSSKSKIFWNESVGGPSMIDYKSYNGDGPLYIFKNNGDFENYCVQKNINPSIRSYLPRREIIFNPGLSGGLNDEYYNLFEESEYMKKDYSTLPPLALNQIVSELEKRCKVIYEILINIFGEKEYLERFMNWIAYILQKKEKSYTAWLITSNVQGVGKDLMFHRMLQPLFGEKQSQIMNGNRIAKNFNKIDMNCFLRGYNEVFSAGNIKENLHRKEMLKDLITAPYQSIEIKGVDTFQTHNFMNFILFSNSEHPIFIDEEDRRFNVIRNDNVVKVDELSIYKEEKDLEPDIANELEDFANIIFTVQYSRELANKPIETEAKNRLKELSKDEYEEFAEKLKAKDSSSFLLDEIFPKTEEVNLGLKPDIGGMIENYIDKDGVIPATYMSKICKYHFPYKNYRQNLQRLKLKGVESDNKRIGSITMKVYECK